MTAYPAMLIKKTIWFRMTTVFVKVHRYLYVRSSIISWSGVTQRGVASYSVAGRGLMLTVL